jgi:hypothetical protein
MSNLFLHLTKLGQQCLPLSFMSNYQQGIFSQCKIYYLLVLMDPSKWLGIFAG